MKFLSYSKRILCFLLVFVMLFLACACNSGNNKETEANDNADTQDSDNKGNETAATEKPLLDTDLLLSGEKPFRVIYSEGFKTQAMKIQDRLISLDKSYTNGKYVLAQDTATAADGTPEILVGETNRPASAEAKKLITAEGNFYAVYVSDTAIALCATSAEGVDIGVRELLTNIVRRNSTSVVYNKTKGSYSKDFEPTVAEGSTLLELLTNTAKLKKLPVISIAVSDENGIKSESIIAGNPCQNCYSVTKVYCVTAIGMLYDEGKIKMEDTIGEIFKEEIAAYGIDENKWADITIHDVLKHKAGFKQGGLLDIDAQDATKWASQDYLKLTLEAEIDGNKTSRYTDAAYYLISRVVTKISGETLDIFLAKRLFNKTECREFAFATCPQGYPIGATGLYIRSSDVAKLGRIYLDGGKYKDQQIISKEWVDLVLEKGYELNKSGTGYAKGGMRGQYLYINFNKNTAVAWHSYDPNDTTWPIGDALKEYMK